MDCPICGNKVALLMVGPFLNHTVTVFVMACNNPDCDTESDVDLEKESDVELEKEIEGKDETSRTS
jgi:hypothetical protein